MKPIKSPFICLILMFTLLMAMVLASCSPKFAGQQQLVPGTDGSAIREEARESETPINETSSELPDSSPGVVTIEVTDMVLKEPDIEAPIPDALDKSTEPPEASRQTQKPDESASEPGSEKSWMRSECEDYYEMLVSSATQQDLKRIEQLKTAESILEPGPLPEDGNAPLELDRWQRTLNEALGIDMDEVLNYTALSSSEFLTYDTAAISLFKLGFIINAFEIRDATEDEIAEARRLVPRLNEAMDISKFSQMVSSGLIRGISQMEGFSPQSPVTREEAMLLIKRVVERIP